jgi:predicted RNA binding protein YcfA (HicA-like mRNA interferase family)
MPKLPQVSGNEIVKLLQHLDYKVVRQRGSHIRLRRITPLGEHNITVSAHKVLAKGTLNDILTRVSLWNNIPKKELIDRLR